MYLTRFEINTTRRQSHRLLASPQRLHAAILKSFPANQLTNRILWRIDKDQNKRAELLIVSHHGPDLTGLVEQAGWPSTASWETADYTRLLDRLTTGQQWRFRLTANPTKTIRAQPHARGKPIPLTINHQHSWLHERANTLGIDLGRPDPTFHVTRREHLQFYRDTPGKRVHLTTAQFDGLLLVTDPDALRAALVQGIGRAKGYGCGLLTLAPAT